MKPRPRVGLVIKRSVWQLDVQGGRVALTRAYLVLPGIVRLAKRTRALGRPVGTLERSGAMA